MIRLKDALWSLRKCYGMENDLDRIIKYLMFEQDLSRDQLEDILITYPKRTPEDFKSALITKIQQIIRLYWSYRQTRKGYHKVLRGVIFLEAVARHGFEGCQLPFDEVVGYYLELKPEHQGKTK